MTRCRGQLGTRFHAVPIQRTITGLGVSLALTAPPAQAALAETAASHRGDRRVPRAGSAPVFRQRRSRTGSGSADQQPDSAPPTARACRAEVAATPYWWLRSPGARAGHPLPGRAGPAGNQGVADLLRAKPPG